MRSGNWSAPLQLVSSFLNIIWLSGNAMSVISVFVSKGQHKGFPLSPLNSTLFPYFHNFILSEMFPWLFPSLICIKPRTRGLNKNRNSYDIAPFRCRRKINDYLSMVTLQTVQKNEAAPSCLDHLLLNKKQKQINFNTNKDLCPNSSSKAFLSRKRKNTQAQWAGISYCCATRVTLGIACFHTLRNNYRSNRLIATWGKWKKAWLRSTLKSFVTQQPE